MRRRICPKRDTGESFPIVLALDGHCRSHSVIVFDIHCVPPSWQDQTGIHDFLGREGVPPTKIRIHSSLSAWRPLLAGLALPLAAALRQRSIF